MIAASHLQVAVLILCAIPTVGLAVATVISNLFARGPDDLDTRPKHLRSRFPK